MCDCECEEACKTDKYLGIKNCSWEKTSSRLISIRMLK